MDVFWTPQSVATYNKVLDYLAFNWPEKVSDDFIKKTHRIIDLISKGNIKFRSSGRANVHEVLTKHNLLIYRIMPTHIELLRFYDTRQNPRKKKF